MSHPEPALVETDSYTPPKTGVAEERVPDHDLEAQDAHHRENDLSLAVNPARDPINKITIGFTEAEKELSIYLAEFFGTFTFLLSAYLIAGVANFGGDGFDTSRVYNIAFGFGISLLVVAASTAKFSGGHHNPAVAFALFLNGDVSLFRFASEFLVQVIAGMAAAGVGKGLLPGAVSFANSKDASVSTSRALFLEAFGVALLVYTVLFTAIETGPFGGLAYIPIGFSLFLGHLICVPTTGAGLNPARSFGPAIALRSFPGYHWIYWVGPFIGAAVAVLAFRLTKLGESRKTKHE